MRPLLAGMTPLLEPDATLNDAIAGVKPGHNPSDRAGRRPDLKLLASAGSAIECPRVVFATGNARCALALLTREPGGPRRVEFTRPELLTAATALGVVGDLAPFSPAEGTEAALVVDALDIDAHLAHAEREIESGSVRQLILYNAVLSIARRAIDVLVDAHGASADHVPLSEGLAVVRVPRDSGSALVSGLRTLAAESPWHPGRVSSQRAGGGDTEPNVAVKTVKRIASAVAIETGESRTVQRIGALLDDIVLVGRESLPSVLGAWGDPGDASVTSRKQVTPRVRALLECGDQAELALRFLLGEWYDKSLTHAAAVETGAHPPRALSDLASTLYRVREMLWWSRHWDVRENALWKGVLGGGGSSTPRSRPSRSKSWASTSITTGSRGKARRASASKSPPRPCPRGPASVTQGS